MSGRVDKGGALASSGAVQGVFDTIFIARMSKIVFHQ